MELGGDDLSQSANVYDVDAATLEHDNAPVLQLSEGVLVTVSL